MFLIHCGNSKNYDDTFHNIPLNKNGASYGDTKECKSGEMIDMIKYRFYNNLIEEEFSDTEELELCQMCSMQERCGDLRFRF